MNFLFLLMHWGIFSWSMREISKICRDYLFFSFHFHLDLNYDSKSSCKLDESSDSWLTWNRVLAKLDNTNLRIGLIATTTMTDTTLLMLWNMMHILSFYLWIQKMNLFLITLISPCSNCESFVFGFSWKFKILYIKWGYCYEN